MKKYFSVFFLFFVLIAIILTSEPSMKVMKRIFFTQGKDSGNQIVVVIDPGHGGRDPGKVGINNILEKDINLCISMKLKNLLEQNDIKVYMTREDDNGLYSQSDAYKKRADLDNRVDFIHEKHADIAISIHENSFPEEYVKGAQTFYYDKSLGGKVLAEMIQDQVKKTIADGNHRVAKSNTSYYMLRKTECPLVIVECGYLTNYKESSLLIKDDYQERMAFGIHLGIMQYINQSGLKAGKADMDDTIDQ